MDRLTRNRWVKWLSVEDYSSLPESVRDRLHEFQRHSYNLVRKQEILDTLVSRRNKLTEEITSVRKKVREMMNTETVLYSLVQQLNPEYFPSMSITGQMKDEKGPYWNVTISVRGKPSKSIYLGEDSIVRSLLLDRGHNLKGISEVRFKRLILNLLEPEVRKLIQNDIDLFWNTKHDWKTMI